VGWRAHPAAAPNITAAGEIMRAIKANISVGEVAPYSPPMVNTAALPAQK
jgi:hypothetical protein